MSMFINGVDDLIENATNKYHEAVEVLKVRDIPTVTSDYPHGSNKWLKIENVVCVFIDMKNSTQLSAQKHDKSTAAIYEYFTGTAVRMLNLFGASYIDVRGDGAFGLFNKNKIYHALSSAITFKSFVQEIVKSNVRIENIQINCHIGIDQKTVLVKRVGMKNSGDQNDRQNEVWAGKPVNMASKLASIGNANELIVSERVFAKFKSGDSEFVMRGCGCQNGVYTGKKTDLWAPLDLNILGFKNSRNFDFDFAHVLKSGWCPTHGQEFCEGTLGLDE